jgi:hypothetical protein
MGSMSDALRALIPASAGKRRFPEEDYGITERVEAAAILLGQMRPSQVAQRIVSAYHCDLTTAYDYVRQARAFLAGLRNRSRDTIFHEISERLESIALNPAASMADKLKANHLLMGLHGLRRQPAAPEGEPPLFDREE